MVCKSGGAGLPHAKIWGCPSTPCPPYFSAPDYTQVEAVSGRGDNAGTTVSRLYPALLPFNVSLCPANISGTVFDCPGLDISTTTSVHTLKPNDIEVVVSI